MGSLNSLGAKPRPAGKKKKDKDDEDDMKNKKLADELNDMHEVSSGVFGEMTTVDHAHKHEFKMDPQGNGKTISTLGVPCRVMENPEPHVHLIVGGTIQESLGHTHYFSNEG